MCGECEMTAVSQTFDESLTSIRHIPVPMLPFRSRWINQLWFDWYSRKVTRKGFDIVHSHENVTHGNVQTVHVKTVHASLAQRGTSRFRRWLSPRLLAYLWIEKRRLCSSGCQNVFVSQLLLDETREHLSCLSSATFIPPGVELPVGAAGDAEKIEARKKLGLPAGAKVIGFIGHDFKKKGLPVLLQALAQIPEDAILLVIGKNSQASEYTNQIRTLGNGKACRFLGVVQDMPTVYAAIDCLAHPTTQDVFPMVMLEAMANRVPVITTDAPFNSMASLLSDQVNTLLIKDPSDYPALANALRCVLNDSEVKLRLIEGGVEFASKYSWTTIKNQYYEVYRAAMAR
jgi:UDP-glucose:(heptosyl)LPS alpha-1,3-glucosyltransferase